MLNDVFGPINVILEFGDAFSNHPVCIRNMIFKLIEIAFSFLNTCSIQLQFIIEYITVKTIRVGLHTV